MTHSLLKELLELRASFKSSSGEDLERKIRRRTEIHLKYPEYDPMLEAWRPIAEKYREMFKGKILDAGCGSGYLYHFLGKPSGYVGVDISPSFIKVAREFAPEADFRVQDFLRMTEHFDMAWCSSLVFPKMKVKADDALSLLKRLAPSGILVFASGHGPDFSYPAEQFGRMWAHVWRTD